MVFCWVVVEGQVVIGAGAAENKAGHKLQCHPSLPSQGLRQKSNYWEEASTEIPLLWPWLKAFRTLADWIISLGSLAFLQFSPSAQCLVVSLKSWYSDPFKWYVCCMIGAKWGVHQSRPWKIKGFVQIVATHPHPPTLPLMLCCPSSRSTRFYPKLPVSWAKWKRVCSLCKNIKWKLVYLCFFEVNWLWNSEARLREKKLWQDRGDGS